MRRRFALLGLAALACGVLFGGGSLRDARADALGDIENEFEKAITKVSPTTVVCVPHGVKAGPKMRPGLSSGVVITRKGLILSDGDVGAFSVITGKGSNRKIEQSFKDEIEIRIPDLKGRGFRSYKAKVVVRERLLDSSLLQMEKPPSGLRFLTTGDSDALQVGDFAFAMGNSFGLASEAPPTLTAGLISGLVPQGVESGSKYRLIYTSAAVNQGVNGGPLVDIEGRLIGVISGPELPWAPKTNDANRPFQFLGRVTPINLLKDYYAKIPETAEIFKEAKATRAKSRKSALLETVFHETGKRAYRSLVSIEIARKDDKPYKRMMVASRRGLQPLPRYSGPVSGILIADGYVITSIYNLANTVGVVHALPPNVPDEAKFGHGYAQIAKVTVHVPDGRAVPAKIVGRHEGIGVALIKLDPDKEDADRSYAAPLLQPVPEAYFETGRIVLGVANPFGKQRAHDPLLTFGILSKQHAPDQGKRWDGQWQTDCSGTDATAGGAIVDLRGRLVGMHQVWDPGQHGRNSGISFVVPWTQIEPLLDLLKAGRVFQKPFLGVSWGARDGPGLLLSSIVEGAPAHRVGLKKGDVVLSINGKEVMTPEDARQLLRGKWSGDEVTLSVLRDGKSLEIKVTLGARGS